jgi:hypothetical protein
MYKHTCACTYIHTYVCMPVSVYVCMYVCIHVYTHAHTYYVTVNPHDVTDFTNQHINFA